MQKYFECQDGKTRLITQCLSKCPRTEGRCLSLPTLTEASEARATQLSNPLRIEYLKLTEDYCIDPLKISHSYDFTNWRDYLEPDELSPGCHKIIGRIAWGSFAIAKLLGLKESTDTLTGQNLTFDLNHARILAEATGFHISRIAVEITVNDAGYANALKLGVKFPRKLFGIRILDSSLVIEQFEAREASLQEALDSKTLPALCTDEESWNTRRCIADCDVCEFCPEGKAVNKAKGKI